jgi:hypothetical protein
MDSVSIAKQPVELPAEVHARFNCKDCPVNVLDVGDWYMAWPEIWKGLGLGWHDNLCIPCLQKRLGRPFRDGWQDVVPAQSYPWSPGISRRTWAAIGIDIDAVIRDQEKREARKRKARNKRRRELYRERRAAA